MKLYQLHDPHHLNRFISAQEPVYETVCHELASGHKTSHWIWFIFPQLKGLGRSYNSEFYGIASAEEAKEYLQHPVLGPRLIHSTELTNSINGRTIEQILGDVDAQKFRSCMTLFAIATPETHVFAYALQKYFGGERDELTVRMVGA